MVKQLVEAAMRIVIVSDYGTVNGGAAKPLYVTL